jgi:hypothetical protein
MQCVDLVFIIYLSIYLSIYLLSIYLPIINYLSICLSSIYLSIIYLFRFCSTGVWAQGFALVRWTLYLLRHSTCPVLYYFQDMASKTICLISASWVARITGISHWYWALYFLYSLKNIVCVIKRIRRREICFSLVKADVKMAEVPNVRWWQKEREVRVQQSLSILSFYLCFCHMKSCIGLYSQ